MDTNNIAIVGLEDKMPPRVIGDKRVVSWKSLRDRIAPQGRPVKASELIDRTFTIINMRSYQSQYSGRDTVYWVVVLTDDGELMNTTLGGMAVCDVLDKISYLRRAYDQAVESNNRQRMAELEEIGATSLFQFTLRWASGGQGEGYYYFE